MRKLTVLDADMMIPAIHDEIRRSGQARYEHRLHGVLFVATGMSAREVAQRLGQAPRTVQNWVRQFNKSGFAGLMEEERPGRPRELDEITLKKLAKDLRRDPRSFEYSQNLWDGKLLSHHLENKYQMSLGVRQCQRLFHELGFRLRKPRPFLASADPEAKKTYKKTEIPE